MSRKQREITAIPNAYHDCDHCKSRKGVLKIGFTGLWFFLCKDCRQALLAVLAKEAKQ